ncbi:MAG: hypothetical protein AB7N76_37000 [Planctomycetota bacterium]
MPELIRRPAFAVAALRRYRLRAREKTSFQSVLSADDIIDPTGARTADIRLEQEGSELRLGFEFPLARGCIREVLTLTPQGEGLRAARLVRSVYTHAELRVRHEEIDFSDATIPLPESSYPEVALPFLLSWQPHDGKTRDLYAWINDRFVARVEYQSKGKDPVQLDGRRRDAVYVVMYPDFNDWVRLGKVLNKLAYPFLPKYHMWFDPQPPHAVLRFEGPYGPPGAPEVVMELVEG